MTGKSYAAIMPPGGKPGDGSSSRRRAGWRAREAGKGPAAGSAVPTALPHTPARGCPGNPRPAVPAGAGCSPCFPRRREQS